MSSFRVELKKLVDDSYDVLIGENLQDNLLEDLKAGLVGNIKKIAIITDTNVEKLYARPIYEKLAQAGYQCDLFVFEAGEKSKVRKKKK